MKELSEEGRKLISFCVTLCLKIVDGSRCRHAEGKVIFIPKAGVSVQRNEYSILVRIPEGKRPVRTPSHRQEET
jgi:hypothetical protein